MSGKKYFISVPPLCVRSSALYYHQSSVCVVFCGYESVDLLIKDEVRGKVEQLSIGVFVGTPAEAKGGQTHP